MNNKLTYTSEETAKLCRGFLHRGILIGFLLTLGITLVIIAVTAK